MDMEQLAEATFDVVQRYLSTELDKRDRVIAEQGAAIASLKAQLSSLPTPKDGINGKDGANGQDGLKGQDGKSGVDGRDGKDGLNGKDGTNGRDGTDGIDGKDGRDGVNGKDAEMFTLELAELADILKADKDFAAMCKARDGENGKSADPEQTEALVIRLVAKAIDAIPRPRDGLNGKDGRDGRDGESPAVELVVAKLLPLIPKARDGESGQNGKDGADGQAGKDGRDGLNGKDGADGLDGKGCDLAEVEKLLIEPRAASWALDFERRAQAVLREAINAVPLPRDGRDGIDGTPGVGLDSFEFFADQMGDGRTVELGLRANGREVRKSITFDVPLDRGVYRSGSTYRTGDGVTYSGQWYIAQRATDAKPGESGDWRLAVKRGRDGKDAAE